MHPLVYKIVDALEGKEYPLRIPAHLVEEAKKARLVIVFGASDDLMEFRGAIDDEFGVGDGTKVMIGPKGLMPEWGSINKRDPNVMREYFKTEGQGKPIKAIWSRDNISWQYETSIPHMAFDIMEDEDTYCRGIVFSLDVLEGEVKPKPVKTIMVIRDEKLRELVDVANTLLVTLASYTHEKPDTYFVRPTKKGNEMAMLTSMVPRGGTHNYSSADMEAHIVCLKELLNNLEAEKVFLQKVKIVQEKIGSALTTEEWKIFLSAYELDIEPLDTRWPR